MSVTLKKKLDLPAPGSSACVSPPPGATRPVSAPASAPQPVSVLASAPPLVSEPLVSAHPSSSQPSSTPLVSAPTLSVTLGGSPSLASPPPKVPALAASSVASPPLGAALPKVPLLASPLVGAPWDAESARCADALSAEIDALGALEDAVVEARALLKDYDLRARVLLDRLCAADARVWGAERHQARVEEKTVTQRTVVDLPGVARHLGAETFMQLARVSLADLDLYLSEAQKADVLKVSSRTSYTLKIVRK